MMDPNYNQRRRDASQALPPMHDPTGTTNEKEKKKEKTGNSGGEKEKKTVSREILNELVEVVTKYATAPLLKSLRLGPLADFKVEMSLKKVAAEDYILDPMSPGYTTFMEFCKKQNSHDYLLCFTHFNNKMINEQAKNYEKFMILFDEAWEKFLKINSKQRVSLGDDHGRNEAALQKCFDKYWVDGNPRSLEYFLPPPDELVAVVKKHAKDPLLKTLKQGPFADFKLEKSFQEFPSKTRSDDEKALKYVLDPKSDGYTVFMEFCKKQNSHDYLLSFTHFNNKMIEDQPSYVTFMKHFDSAWKKFLNDNAKQSVGLGADNAKHIDALQSCFDKYWANGKLAFPS